MSAKDGGGSAFPTPDISGHAGSDGMTLRDYFAAAALQGFLVTNQYPNQERIDNVVERAFAVADAMLERRKQ